MDNKIILTIASMAIFLFGCTMSKQPNNTSGESSENTTAKGAQFEDTDVPPALAVYVNGLPLFAPFNEGDIMAEGKMLRQSPEKYTKFILNGACLDITYKEEKNKDLDHDTSYINEYYYQMEDEETGQKLDGMKGQIFSFADAKAVEKYMQTHGDRTEEGELIPMDYTDGIIVSADYLKDRTVMEGHYTTTEDPLGPQFDASTEAAVEKIVGAQVLKNRIRYVIGDEYHFGIMTTQPNDKFGVAAWVLEKAGEVTVWTDTCEVIDGEINWSNYDPEEYNEPCIIAVVKGKEGLDIFCTHMSTDESVNYYLMRQRGKKMTRYPMGSFYQRYH